MDDEFRRKLQAEEEIDTIFDEQEARFLKKMAESEKGKQEAEKRTQEAEKREHLERFQKEEECTQKVFLAIKLAVYMKQNGAGTAEISKETGLSPDKIMDL